MSGTISWSSEMVKILIEECLVVKHSIGFADSGFKKQHWMLILNEFCKRSRKSVSKGKLHNKHSELKKDFGIWKELCNNSGFGWDENSNLPTAPGDVWDRYLNANPKARKFRNKALEFNDLLYNLFDGERATGEFALAAGGSISRRL